MEGAWERTNAFASPGVPTRSRRTNPGGSVCADASGAIHPANGLRVTVTADAIETPKADRGVLWASYRWAEMVVLFFLVPGLLAAFVDPHGLVRPWAETAGLGDLYTLLDRRSAVLMPALVLFTLFVLAWLVLDSSFKTRQLWNFRAGRLEGGRVFAVFAVAGPMMLGIGWALHEFTDVLTITRGGETGTAFLRLPREAPVILLFIGLLYPWFSAYPQEITHRAFFFHRYEALFSPTRGGRIGFYLVNAVAFAWLHVPFWSWVALALTFPGGLLFAWTYDRSRSALAAGMEHGLYGWWAFAVGLGYFVFTGSIGA